MFVKDLDTMAMSTVKSAKGSSVTEAGQVVPMLSVPPKGKDAKMEGTSGLLFAICLSCCLPLHFGNHSFVEQQ